MSKVFVFFCIFISSVLFGKEQVVETGLDLFFKNGYDKLIKNKSIGIVANHTSLNKELKPIIQIFKSYEKEYKIKAIFSPEHGFNGAGYAWESVSDSIGPFNIPVFSLHGKTRRPTSKMLEGVDVIIYDLQNTGCRTYTYETTLFYLMEEAAKQKIEIIVLDRPNPIGGIIVDGPMLKEEKRSYIGYINVPYCHGMTIGELAKFFNEEYKIGCKLSVVPMKGWKRSMSFEDTGLTWIPTSPNIPESDTPAFSAATGILGELSIVNIGVGYTMPFKLVGAPWINAEKFAARLNEQKLPGVLFAPFHYRPFYGLFKGTECGGVHILITDNKIFRPLSVQYMLIGVLKSMYLKQFGQALSSISNSQKELFCLANGNDEMFDIIRNEKYVAWKLIQFDKQERAKFLKTRKKYLLY